MRQLERNEFKYVKIYIISSNLKIFYDKKMFEGLNINIPIL